MRGTDIVSSKFHDEICDHRYNVAVSVIEPRCEYRTAGLSSMVLSDRENRKGCPLMDPMVLNLEIREEMLTKSTCQEYIR